MPIKEATANPFDAPKLREKSERPTKQDLLGSLVVLRLREYDPEFSSRFGTTQAAFLEELYVCDGEHAGVYQDKAYFGLIARQIGEALEAGQIAPARVVSGTTKAGSKWTGVDFDLDPKDLEAATAYYQSAAPAPF